MPGPNLPDSLPGAVIARQVADRGIRDPRIVAALARISRAHFLPPAVREHAHADRAVPIGLDQTISQPYMVAVMTRELKLQGKQRVLEVGTGSGYQTAVLSDLAVQVYTIERIGTLSLRARSLLDGLGRTNVRYRIGDGTLGWPDEAPFDRILVTAGAPEVPQALVNQLAEGGLLVAPVGDQECQQLLVVCKKKGKAVSRAVMACRFVKLIGAEGWAEE